MSGISGFIGSHVAELALNNGFEIMALKRPSSDLRRCSGFHERIIWVTEDSLQDEFVQFGPDIIIHMAWEGISALERDNWTLQLKNLALFIKLTELCRHVSATKFISFGSQAEYGNIQGRVSETTNPEPNNAYGVTKLAAQRALQILCEKDKIEWYWLRVYSVFGPREDKNWFIPMVITSLLKNIPLKLTECEQRYDYLYVKDLAGMILKIVEHPVNRSGIYNISSNGSKSLRTMINEINLIVGSESEIFFGALPYRDNQAMHIEGDTTRYKNIFGEYDYTDLNAALKTTIDYYRI